MPKYDICLSRIQGSINLYVSNSKDNIYIYPAANMNVITRIMYEVGTMFNLRNIYNKLFDYRYFQSTENTVLLGCNLYNLKYGKT